MINVHLNGEIVRCPDIAAIRKRANEIRDKHRICLYNYHEDDCKVWNESITNFMEVKKHNCAGRCSLSGKNDCPGHKIRSEHGSKAKKFKIDSVNYRKLASAGHYLVKTSKYKSLFLTLTFPKFKVDPNKKCKNEFFKAIFEKHINECFSKFVENLRKNYNCTGYVAVREYGTDNHRIHFHIVCSIPFTAFSDLNNAWCAAISDICNYSKNAITTRRDNRILRNPGAAIRYICKYISKAKNQESDTRLIFISNNLLRKHISIDCDVVTLLKGYKGIYINQSSDFTTVYRITDSKSFDLFCKEFLYDLFEIPMGKTDFLHPAPN